MSEEIENVEKVSEGTSKWVKNLVAIIFALGIGYNTYTTVLIQMFPNKFASDVEEATIKADVAILKEEVKNELRAEYDVKLKEAAAEHDRIHALYTGTLAELNSIKEQNRVFQELATNQLNFNTHNIGTLSQATFELMQDDKDCGTVRHSRGIVDRYICWEEDYHKFPTLQRVTASSGCVATIHPQGRSAIRIKLNPL